MNEVNKIVIDARRKVTVPEEIKQIGVQGDHNIETITFECPRYWDKADLGENAHDLSKMSIYINFMRPDGETGRTQCTLIEDKLTEETMCFTWTVTRHTTVINGNISFLVNAELIEQRLDENGEPVYDAENQPVYDLKYSWNSEVNRDLCISEGLDALTQIEEYNADVIEALLLRMNQLESIGLSHVIGVEETEDGYRVTMTDSTCIDDPQVIEIKHGDNGATFIPSVDQNGTLSWSNDKELPNPDPVNIKGEKGDKGNTGSVYETIEVVDKIATLEPLRKYRVKPNIFEGESGVVRLYEPYTDILDRDDFHGSITSNIASVAYGSYIYLFGEIDIDKADDNHGKEYGLYKINTKNGVVETIWSTKEYSITFSNSNHHMTEYLSCDGHTKSAAIVGDYFYFFNDLAGWHDDEITIKIGLDTSSNTLKSPQMAEDSFNIESINLKSSIATIGSNIYYLKKAEGTVTVDGEVLSKGAYCVYCIDTVNGGAHKVVGYIHPYTSSDEGSIILLPVGTKLYMFYSSVEYAKYYTNTNNLTPVYVYDTATGKTDYLYVDFKMEYKATPKEENTAVIGSDIYIYHSDGVKIFDTLTNEVRMSKEMVNHIPDLSTEDGYKSINAVGFVDENGKNYGYVLYGKNSTRCFPYRINCKVALKFGETEYPFDLTLFDEHRDFFTFEILSLETNRDNTKLTVVYELNGRRFTTTIAGSAFNIDECELVIADTGDEGTMEVFRENLVESDITNPGSGSSIELDDTLTQEGKAADAKAVGDKLAGKVSREEAPDTSYKYGVYAIDTSTGEPITIYAKADRFIDDTLPIRTIGGQLLGPDPQSASAYSTRRYVDYKFNGANKAVVFANYAKLVEALDGENPPKLIVGQNVYLSELDIPDLWVAHVFTAEDWVEGVHTGEEVATALKETGQVIIGGYGFHMLETQKVDLTEYAKTEQLDGKLDKLTKKQAVYATNANAETYAFSFSSQADPNTFAYRSTAGKLAVATATEEDSGKVVVNKEYVANEIENNKRYLHEYFIHGEDDYAYRKLTIRLISTQSTAYLTFADIATVTDDYGNSGYATHINDLFFVSYTEQQFSNGEYAVSAVDEITFWTEESTIGVGIEAPSGVIRDLYFDLNEPLNLVKITQI